MGHASIDVRRTGAADPELDRALLEAGAKVIGTDAASLVHRLPAVAELDGLTPALTAWAAEARRTTGADGDVLTLVDAAGFAHDAVAPAMLAHGIVAGTRALAMERERAGTRANLVVVGSEVEVAELADVLRWLLHARATSGRVVELGAPRHGRQPA
ncbi:MAG: hypothetical protein JJT89_13365 [Nitriliruptoraceae bacterium]|nr:hypothetical protein [Nitriliruptoraceae bacterium]